MDQSELQTTWEFIKLKMQDELAEDVCRQWFGKVVPIKITEDTLELLAPNGFTKSWIEKNYFKLLQNAALAITEKNLEIIFSLPTEEAKPEAEQPVLPEKTIVQPTLLDDSREGEEKTAAPAESSHSSDTEQIAPGDASSLNPKYVFDTFVQGSSNNLAYVASLAVAESPGKVYNPLFMYGGVGLGKTHLMHAIGHRVLANHPEMRVLYITSEKFTNELINSIRDGNPEAFRQKYRNIDVLLVDDIQFLSKKERTQEEFFHTFNALHDAGKHIILSSDRPPKEIQTLEDRLRSRFEWGMIADIQPPDLETRIAILRKKAQLDKLDVPNDVMVYIASRIDNNIRELEGALTRVIAYAQLNNEEVTTDLVARALKDIFQTEKTKEITLELIQEIVATHFKIKIEDMKSTKRTKAIAYPRQIAMYLCRELTDTSLPQIGDFFQRDHSTVIHACEKISKDREGDSKLNHTVQELINRIERF